jgi:hypothetical protein
VSHLSQAYNFVREFQLISEDTALGNLAFYLCVEWIATETDYRKLSSNDEFTELLKGFENNKAKDENICLDLDKAQNDLSI